jgi:PTH1 family peptidyl-tRNA hydrolase
MKLIVGLGNPGDIYIQSRHNIGFSVVKSLAKNQRLTFRKEFNASSLIAKAKIKQQQVILALPVTFMNLSGNAVARLIRKYRIDLDNLLIVCDDLDLALGRLKLKPNGSSGGHRGLESIIDSLGNDGFARLRIGIGRSSCGIDAAEYVLSPFTKEEKIKVKRILEEANLCCASWVTKGITRTMNIFNKSASTSLGTSTRSILSKRSESKEHDDE